jgi:hypothetical protein
VTPGVGFGAGFRDNGDQEERRHPDGGGSGGEEGVPPSRPQRAAGRKPEDHRRQPHPRLRSHHQVPHGEGRQGHPGQPSGEAEISSSVSASLLLVSSVCESEIGCKWKA